MRFLNMYELRQGMVLGNAIYSQDKKLLLNQGVVLSESKIKYIKSLGIQKVEIVDPYTLLVNPRDGVKKILKSMFLHGIRRYAPKAIEGNLGDHMVEVANRACRLIDDLIENEEVLDFCVEMKLVNNKYLFEQSVITAVLSVLVAGAMGLSEEEMKQIGIGALLHNIGMCEMLFLLIKIT